MSTPTPRTSSAIIASGFQAVPEGFRAFAGILERELTALTAERDQLCAALALGQINCDDAYDDLRDERDAAIARAERAEAEVSKLTDALDMMRDEFMRIIACPGCNAEIEDLANRAQLKLIQRVPVITQRDRAEAELDGIRALADRRNKRYHVEDTTHQLVAALDQALDIAQAELATERARLDWLESDAGVDWQWSDDARTVSRASIDAFIKEGAK